jgi:hypothetical protein
MRQFCVFLAEVIKIGIEVSRINFDFVRTLVLFF